MRGGYKMYFSPDRGDYGHFVTSINEMPTRLVSFQA